MSQKTIFYIGLGVIALVVLGFLGFTQLNDNSEEPETTTETITLEQSSQESSVADQTIDDDANSEASESEPEDTSGELSFEVPTSVTQKSSSDLFKRDVNPSNCEYYGESEDLVVVLFTSGSNCVRSSNYSGQDDVEIGDFELTRSTRQSNKGEEVRFERYRVDGQLRVGFIYKGFNESDVQSSMEAVLESLN